MYECERGRKTEAERAHRSGCKMPGWVGPASAETRTLQPLGGLGRARRPSCASATRAGCFLGAVGMGLVLESDALAPGRCRVIKKIMKVGADGCHQKS